jgi:hypothetical protein
MTMVIILMMVMMMMMLFIMIMITSVLQDPLPPLPTHTGLNTIQHYFCCMNILSYIMYCILYIADCDCPYCAPYCSTNGYCEPSSADGSTPCDHKECYTDDDCYIEPDAFLSLHGRNNCLAYDAHNAHCTDMHECVYYLQPGHCSGNRPHICKLAEGAIGDNCQQSVAECIQKAEAAEQAGEPEMAVCGTSFTNLKILSAKAGISLQLEAGSRKRAGQCGSGRCRTRTGACSQPVWRDSRWICPYYY